MDRSDRIQTLKQWGQLITATDWSSHYDDITRANPWFTDDDISSAIQGINKFLDASNLNQWLARYPEMTDKSKNIGIVMAGNLPLVGFHDLLCVFVSGHNAKVKLSSQDSILLPLFYHGLVSIVPKVQQRIEFVAHLHPSTIDALIATGSDNTARYIRHKYSKMPRIIRSNRSSVAVLTGKESKAQLSGLGEDILMYFGKGCRNVSKLFVPDRFNFDEMIASNRRFESLLDHEKYSNNYRYQKALFRTRGIDFIDTGYLLITENRSTVSPLAVVYFETYRDPDHLEYIVNQNQQKIQCIASAKQWYPSSFDFGTLQYPDLWDYADNIDTMKFLETL